MPSNDLSRRLYATEWMDGPCSEEDLRSCLQDLEQVNRVVFVLRPTVRWVGQILAAQRACLHIVDVGCGGGDMLRAIAKWAARRSIPVRLTGTDRNERTLRFAQERTAPASGIRYLLGSAAAHPELADVDLVISSHLTHHLVDEEIVSFLLWMERTARVGWFINDLHRERIPYHAFGLLARWMGWHSFVQHDGPISVLRSFRPEDWAHYLAAAGIEGATIGKAFPGRLCVARTKPGA